MVTSKTINDIKTNVNTGVEYEIALFRCLLVDESEIRQVDAAISARRDVLNVESIIRRTSIQPIISELNNHSLTLSDVSFETQNDDVGPSDIVMTVKSATGEKRCLGISVKYSNTCTLNATGRKFLTGSQIADLKSQLPRYTDEYISEMTRLYGGVGNWFHKRKFSSVTDKYIDLIREKVIANWSRKSEADKKSILMEAYQETSPIPYWVFTYTASSYKLDTNPYKISPSDIPLVEVRKFQTSYIGFYLHGRLIGKMQVKFNSGFVERCKKACPDKVVEGVKMSFGQPFTSWNFCLVRN